MATPRLTFADHGAFQNVQRDEQGRRSMPPVIVRLPLWQSGPQRKNRLGTGRGLNLTFLVHAEHDGLVLRIHVWPYDVAELEGEVGIIAELERLHSMRLQPSPGRSNASHPLELFSSSPPRCRLPLRRKSVCAVHCAAGRKTIRHAVGFIAIAPQQHGRNRSGKLSRQHFL